VNTTADNTGIEKTLQTVELHTEQSEQLSDTNSTGLNLSPLIEKTVSDNLTENPTPLETTAQKYLGSPVNELTIHRIDDIKVLNEYTILFIMRGGAMYLTRLKEPCPALLYASDFNLPSTTGNISKFDRIEAISNNHVMGSTVMLGDFYQYIYEGNKGEAIKLLKKSLLQKLISEEVFSL
jgi:hypothetical protein